MSVSSGPCVSLMPILFHRQEKRETLSRSSVGRGRDDEEPLGLVALAVRLDVAALAQVLVHDPPLGRRERIELDRLARAERPIGGLLAFRPQGLCAARAAALDV